MYTEMEKQILSGLVRKDAISEAIDYILDEHFVFSFISPKTRIKRGIVHNAVAKELNKKLTNSLCIKIRERVLAKGGQLLLSTNKLLYKFVQERKHEM